MVVGNADCAGVFGVLKKFCREGWLHTALQAVERLDRQGISMSTDILFHLLQACSKKKDLAAGREVHALIVRTGFELNSYLGSHLIYMFASCGSLLEANQVFSKLPVRNVFSWGAIISAHAKFGQAKEAIELYEQMQQSSTKPDGHIFVGVLKACASAPALKQGKLIHADTIEGGFEANVYVTNAIIDMYAKFRRLEDAHRVFERSQKRDLVTWNAVIAGYAHHGCYCEMFQLFQQMQSEGMNPDQVTFVCILKACASVGALDQGKLIHAGIIQAGLEFVFVGSTLLDMYIKCRSFDDAHNFFVKLSNRDVVTWNVMINGYIELYDGQNALRMFQEMLQDGMEPNEVTLIGTLRACSIVAALDQGKLLHARIIENDCQSNAVGNTLIDMYAKCGSIKDAVGVLYRLPERDVVTWNAIITGYVEHGHGRGALQLFQQMKQENIIPNMVTYLSVLKACCNQIDLDQSKMVHVHIINGAFEIDESVWNTLVDIYCKCGYVDIARKVFDTLPERGVVTWSAMMSGYAHHGHGQESFQLFQQMQQEGIEPNRVTFLGLLKACSNTLALEQGRQIHAHIIERCWGSDTAIESTLIGMYSKCGSLEEASTVFDKMLKREVVSCSTMICAYAQRGHDLAATHLFWQMQEEGIEANCLTWNALLAGYAHHGHLEESFGLFEHMQQMGAQPNWYTFICLLKACSSSGTVDQGRLIHKHIAKRELEFNFVVGSALITMYAKCGSLGDAYKMFDKLPERDVVTWNAMIAAYAQHNHCQEALKLFQQMMQEGLKPNKTTFVSVLTTCSSTAALQQGKLVHAHILQGGFELEICVGNALIDMYNKCGNLGESCRVFAMLQKRDVVTWSTMMAGYGQSFDYRLAVQCFEDMQREMLKPNDVTFVCLLSAFSRAGLVEEGCQQFKSMQDHCLLPRADHFNSIVNLLGRAGCLIEAEDLLHALPFQCNLVGWTSLLNHCKTHGNVEIGRHCFHSLYIIDSGYATAYTLMSNIYASAGMWENAGDLEQVRNLANAWKKPGKAFIEIGNKSYEFTVGDESHIQTDGIFAKLKRLHEQMMEEGFMSLKIADASVS